MKVSIGERQMRQPGMTDPKVIANRGSGYNEARAARMAQVLLISTAATVRDFWYDECARIRACVDKDSFKVHTVTSDPDAADLIIFFEPEDPHLARDITRHPYVKRFPEKSFVFDPSDRVVPFLPGIYASIQRWQYDPSRMRSGFYPAVFDHDWISYDPHRREPELLFSLVGDIRGIPVREAIATIKHPRAVILDTGSDPANVDGGSVPEVERFRKVFADTLANSKFSLCPRGAGASTFRLFETMKAGRVPVILSDDWVPPEGPLWEAFALVVKERHARRLPAILEAHEAAAAQMGAVAREQWELWFSESVAFHRIVESCLSIRSARRLPERLMRTLVRWQLLTPANFRRKLVPGLRLLLGGRG